MYRISYILTLIVALSFLSGCADMADTSAGGDPSDNGLAPQSDVGDAEIALYQHDLDGAREVYARVLAQNAEAGDAAAGKAITDLLLLPYSEEFTAILTQNLGAQHGLASKSDVIYGDQGFLYLLHRGVPWESSESLTGIKDLLIDDLPWSSEQLDTLENFVTGLDASVNGLADNLTALADAMGEIQHHLDIALVDPDFDTFFLPGETLHAPELAATLGKSELAAVHAVVGFVRGAIYLVSAYEHDWTLEKAFGGGWYQIMEQPEHPEHLAGATWDDYVRTYLDARLGRAIRRSERLTKSRNAFSDALQHLQMTIDFGLETETPALFDWSSVDPQLARDLRELIGAVQNALTKRATIPFTEPKTSMDLSGFFTDGKVLPADIAWTEEVTYRDEYGEYSETQVTDAAIEHVLEGVLDPPYDAEVSVELTLGEGASDFTTNLAGEYQNELEQAF